MVLVHIPNLERLLKIIPHTRHILYDDFILYYSGHLIAIFDGLTPSLRKS
jgi:hypothetical protein